MMRVARFLVTLMVLVSIVASIGFADDEKVHPQVMPDDYEWSMWISPSLPPGDQFERYAVVLASSLPAVHLVAEAGIASPTLDVMRAHAQLIIHVLEGTDGPHANLVTFEPGKTVVDLLAPLESSLDLLKRVNDERHNSGIVYMKGGLLWVIDWALPQLRSYAQEIHPDVARRAQVVAIGMQVQLLMMRALDSAIACIESPQIEQAAHHMLDTSAFVFAALGSPFTAQSRPVVGMGLYFLTHNLLGWTWFGN